MIQELTNHVWQTTVFVCAAGLLAAALRGTRAKVRYWLWFSASLKFLVPFALLITLGRQVQWTPPASVIPAAVVQFSEPFAPVPLPAPSPRGSRDLLPLLLGAIWACGFTVVAAIRLRAWLRVRAAVRSSVPAAVQASVPVRTSPGLLEPGVVGLARPVLLLPAGIDEKLTPMQLQAVLAHEVCHVRRRDNLTAACHMFVEAVFWFHPLVWWIGARLVAERERACDEEVLRLGGAPDVYAEAILKVCRHYLESPLVCVSGMSGSDLKQRIHGILSGRVAAELNLARKAMLVVVGLAALAAPVVIGMMHPPVLRAQPQATQPAVAPAPVRQSVAPRSFVPQTAAAPAAAAPAPTPAPAQEDEHARRVAYAREHFGPPPTPMSLTYIRYGPPDTKVFRGDSQTGVEVWTYHYLEDFHSNVEFEFSVGKRPAGMRINWPPPTATFQGDAGSAETLVDALNQESQARHQPATATATPGLPGQHASYVIYPAKDYSVLSIPLDSFTGPVDLIGQIRQRTDTADPGPVVANFRDFVPAPAGSYQARFTLGSGSYVCKLLVRENTSGHMYTEVLPFEVK